MTSFILLFLEYVQPICLPHGPLSHKQLVHKHVAIAGWGAVDIEDFTPAVHLMYVILPIVDQEQCDSMYPYKITESQLCIGYGEGGGYISKDLHSELKQTYVLA